MYKKTRQEIMRLEIPIRHESEVNKSSCELDKTVKKTFQHCGNQAKEYNKLRSIYL